MGGGTKSGCWSSRPDIHFSQMPLEPRGRKRGSFSCALLASFGYRQRHDRGNLDIAGHRKNRTTHALGSLLVALLLVVGMLAHAGSEAIDVGHDGPAYRLADANWVMPSRSDRVSLVQRQVAAAPSHGHEAGLVPGAVPGLPHSPNHFVLHAQKRPSTKTCGASPYFACGPPERA